MVGSKLEMFFPLFLIDCLNFIPLNNGVGPVHKIIFSFYIPTSKTSAQPGDYFRKITFNKIHTIIKHNQNVLTLL